MGNLVFAATNPTPIRACSFSAAGLSPRPDRKFPDASIQPVDSPVRTRRRRRPVPQFQTHPRVRTGDTKHTVLRLPDEPTHVLPKLLISPVSSPPFRLLAPAIRCWIDGYERILPNAGRRPVAG